MGCLAQGNEPLTFAWRRKTEDHRSTQALRMRSGLTELVGLGEEASSLTAEVNLEVTQGVAREVKIQLPESVTMNQVLGAMVADWESKAGELRVTFLEPVEQRAAIRDHRRGQKPPRRDDRDTFDPTYGQRKGNGRRGRGNPGRRRNQGGAEGRPGERRRDGPGRNGGQPPIAIACRLSISRRKTPVPTGRCA